ncbi:secretion protein [Pseudoalteromonas luteoviolacea]|uniref:Secretion protein n=1 Tax=Pseudoalteromonas luteoviolacea TaxID=43657 RepID=A0A1C0TRV9_9GAMM|nr:basic secretory protein-like protein [Pseudoalteromonas luteoviolacea]MBQ4810615.1 secretion protein [Pseudoalteromonas luteoviolacea]OCQ21979.1 secretion protein [Pseudoalteromonas luteoviolacea]
MKAKAVILAFAATVSLMAHSATAATEEIRTEIKPIQFNGDINWLAFDLPNVQIRYFSQDQVAVWQHIDVNLIKQISYNVARILYKEEHKAPKLPLLEIVLEDMDGVAYKEGDFSGAKIHISAQYLNKYKLTHSPQAVYDELIGILYHEIAHAYQLDDHNYKEIGPVIEGIADVVRMKGGYVDFSSRKQGGNYDSGYKTTAFFLHWLESNHHPDLLVELNAQLDPHDKKKWSWGSFSKEKNINLDIAWSNYQKSL